MEEHTSFSNYTLKLQSLGVDENGHNIRSLAQNCFLWSLYAKKPITTAQLLDAVALDHKTSPERTKTRDHGGYYNDLTDVRKATCNLLLISGFALNRVRPLDHNSERFISSVLPLHDGPAAVGLEEFFPSQHVANVRLATFCLEFLLSDTPPAESLSTILPYCASYFDAHIRSIIPPPGVLNLLETLLNTGPANLRKIISFRYPTTTTGDDEDGFPEEVDCPGSPASIEPGFFLRCVGLHDKVPREIWSRFANRNGKYPEEYLHLASVAGLTDIVSSIVSSAGVDIDRRDGAGFTALQYAVQAGNHEVVKILLNSKESGKDIVDNKHVGSITKESVEFRPKSRL